MQLHFDAPSVASLKGASVMRAAEAETQRSVCSDRRSELEDAVFEALGKLYDLPPKQAVESAGFVAGQIAAFLADVARLNGDPVQAERARDALDEMSSACRELHEETEAAARTAARARARIEAISLGAANRSRISPLALAARLD